MKLLAHIAKIDELRKEQSLRDHCFQTADFAAESIGTAAFHHLARLAGLLHDMGKAKKEFADYLEAAFQGENVVRGSVNHTFAGVIYLFERYHRNENTHWEKLTCEIIGYVIGSHHGMFDCVDPDGKNGFQHRLEKDREMICYREAVANYLSEIADEELLKEYFARAVEEVRIFFEEAKQSYGKEEIFLQISMLARLMLSSVVYGDRRSTREFMLQRTAGGQQEISWDEQREWLEDKLREFSADTELNRVRSCISEQCLQFAERPGGIYRLNVPTGAGKTLCCLRYGLAHAQRYGKKRIIFIIPLLSILDQNVRVLRDYVKDPQIILEHHSNVVREEQKKEELDPYEFLTESWNSPIVVSTLVQLLQILFSHKMSAVERMQALCDSVIVMDEVQSLPKKTTVMFNMALNFLQQFCGATIVLSSATQPCFEELKWPLHLSGEPDMVRLTSQQKQVFERAQVIDRTSVEGMDVEECVNFCGGLMKRHASLLVVCNTKTEARVLYKMLRKRAEKEHWKIYHLSTAMCQANRQKVLAELRDSLASVQGEGQRKESAQRVLCISTQLIEAGVDLSFACAVRILAGIDNLVQTIGRCNRGNEYGQGAGRVYLINLKSENLRMLREIRSAQNSTRKVLEFVKRTEGESCTGDNAVRRFYHFLYRETEREVRYPVKEYGETLYLADLLANKRSGKIVKENSEYVLRQPFRTIGEKFQVFDENTIDIVVPFGEGQELADRLIALRDAPFQMEAFRVLMNKAKPYIVSIYEWQKDRLCQAGLLASAMGGRVLVLDRKAYSEEIGVLDLEEQAVENYIL